MKVPSQVVVDGDAQVVPTGTTISSARQRLAQKRQQHRRWRVWFVRSVIVLLLLLASGIGAIFAFEHTFATRIYPHISIHGVPVGQMTYAEAVATLHTHYDGFVEQPVTLVYGESTWTPTLADLDANLYIDEAVHYALASGRHTSRQDNLRSAAALWQYGLDIPLRLDVDQNTIQEYLLTHLKPVEQPAVDAQVIIDGTRVRVTPARPGRQMLIDETVQDITTALQALEPRVVAVRTRPLAPLLHDADAASAKQAVETLLQDALTLEAHNDSWVWSPADLVRMVHVNRAPDPDNAGDKLVVSFDERLVRQHINWYAEQTEEPGVYPRVNWNGGNLSIFKQGAPGARIDEEQAAAMVLEAVWSSERTVTLPYKDVPVPSTPADLAHLGIAELISVGRSDFTDSEAYRVTNIVAGMRLLHGVLLAPGDEFSFNETVGSIGPQNGFVEGYAIVDDKTQLEWGGGICQDSTTMMRAAFWAGLPFTERWNHSRYINWYDKYGYGEYGDGPGIDSTIFLGGADLRFVNDTDAWILIQSYANPESEIAEVRMYGTRGGRTVEFGGARVSYRDNGFMDVAFTRIIKEEGVEVNRRTYWSTYEPW